MRTAIVHRPIDAAALLAEVADARNGATVLFVGTVREMNDGREVDGIDYRAYEAMAARELERVAREAAERFGTDDLVIEHRLGTLGLGEASVVIAVGHPRRAEAFDAARHALEDLKRTLPIWKLEHYVDGSREWVNASGTEHLPADATGAVIGTRAPADLPSAGTETPGPG